MSMLHPAASLYKGVTSNSELNKNFDNLREILKKRKIKLLSVRDCLKLSRKGLEELASKALVYEAVNEKEGKNNKEFKYYMSDEYKISVLSRLDADQLVDVILSHPTYKLKYSDINTKVEFVDISFKPLGNLLYVRDQQIITQKGVIIGRFNAPQRNIEDKIMRQVFINLGVKIIGETPIGATLEGGDFMIIKPDLALLGIGMRTNVNSAYYLMENDLIGCERLALVIDENEFSQDRMHLDTFFNILNDKNVVLLDFAAMGLNKNNKPLHRKVVIYEKDKLMLIQKKSSQGRILNEEEKKLFEKKKNR